MSTGAHTKSLGLILGTDNAKEFERYGRFKNRNLGIENSWKNATAHTCLRFGT
jgi:hypothetical protein